MKLSLNAEKSKQNFLRLKQKEKPILVTNWKLLLLNIGNMKICRVENSFLIEGMNDETIEFR